MGCMALPDDPHDPHDPHDNRDNRDNRDNDAAPPVCVPFRELSATALRGLIEAFVLREGTDYGEYEYALVDKVAHVLRQLECGEADVMFDPQTNSASIVVARRHADRH